MNCKLGDLAIVVDVAWGSRKDIGKIVKCMEFAPNGTSYKKQVATLDPCWIVKDFYGEKWMHADCRLRPIRPDETPEESLEAMRLLTQIPKEEKV